MTFDRSRTHVTGVLAPAAHNDLDLVSVLVQDLYGRSRHQVAFRSEGRVEGNVETARNGPTHVTKARVKDQSRGEEYFYTKQTEKGWYAIAHAYKKHCLLTRNPILTG